MRVIDTDLPGLRIIEPTVHEDSRGFFMESYNYRDYAKCGLDDIYLQDNHSLSTRGTLRGLHYQLPPGQAKLVRVVVGAVYDVAVDIRRGSPTYGLWRGFWLSAENKRQLYLPTGYAHGFCVVSERAEFLYKVTGYYDPELERGIAWDDPDLAIAWPVAEPLLSPRDRQHPRLRDAENTWGFATPES